MNPSSFLSRRRLIQTAFALALVSLPAVAMARQDASTPSNVLHVTEQGWNLTLRLPSSGIYTGEETILYLRVTQDGTNGEETVPFARIEAKAVLEGDGPNTAKPITFNSYPGGVSGEYALGGTWDTAGSYTMTVTVAPAGNGQPIEAHFAGVTVKTADARSKEEVSPYSLKLDMTPAQPLPGEAVELRISVVDSSTKKRVTDFEPIYEVPMRLYTIREDLGAMRIEKPEQLKAAPNSKDDGIFTLTTAFGTGGTWRLFVEAAPHGEGAQLLSTKVSIPGARALPETLMAQMAPIVRQSGLTMRFKSSVRLVARQTIALPILLEDTQGQPVGDLQILDGSLGHLYFADKDGKAFLHALPDTSDPISGRAGSGQLTFPVRFPRPGIYRAWLNVLRGAQTITLTFVVKVADK